MKLAYYRGITEPYHGDLIFKEHKTLEVGKQYLIHTHSDWEERGRGIHYPITWVEVFDAETSKKISPREATVAFTEEKIKTCRTHDLALLDDRCQIKQCQSCFKKFEVVTQLVPISEKST